MRKLVRVGIVVGFALAGIGLLWFAGTRRSGEPALEPLMLERKRMGVLPRPPQLRGGEDYWEYTRATLADLDADGVPELLALGEVLVHNALKPSGTVWLSLKDGATSTTPLLPLMPSVTNTSGYYSRHATVPPNSLPLAREVVAWDAKTLELLLLNRNRQGWQKRPLDALRGERLQNALAFDIDKDGLLDDYLLQTQSGKLARGTLDASGRFQLQKVEPTTPPSIQSLFNDVRALAQLPPGGVAPLPGMIPEKLLRLPDLDGDGLPESVLTGDSAQRKSASLRLSRTGRSHALPIFGFNLGEQLQAGELDGDAPPEVVIVRKRGNSLQVFVYRVEHDRLKEVGGGLMSVQSEWAPHWLYDLDGDGRMELIIASLPSFEARSIDWQVFRFEGSAFRLVASHRQRVEGRVGSPRQPIKLRSALLLTVDYQPPAFLFAREGGDATLIATLPAGADALDPANWRMTRLERQVPVWSGDYDGDGSEEAVLSGYFRESYLVQVRDGRLRGAKLSENAVVQVLPARIDGKPWLVVLYERGGVELIRALVP